MTGEGLDEELFVELFLPLKTPDGVILATACARVQSIEGSGSGSLCATRGDFQKVPGPLPLFGAAAAFGYSRRLRKRIKVAVPTTIR